MVLAYLLEQDLRSMQLPVLEPLQRQPFQIRDRHTRRFEIVALAVSCMALMKFVSID